MISVCIPAYNNLPAFKRCLESVLFQDHGDFEIIVSDDSSNNLIEEYIGTLNENRLHYYRNNPALGAPENWNNAIAKAKGDYIKILHHDDYLAAKNSLTRFSDVMRRHPNTDFCFCYTDSYFKTKDLHVLHKQTKTQLNRLANDPFFLFYRNVIGAPSATFYKNNSDLRFNNDLKWLVDVEFYIRFLKQSQFVHIKEALVVVVDGEEEQITKSVSDNKELVLREHLTLFSNWYQKSLSTKKSKLFFQELFLKFDIKNSEALSNVTKIPQNLSDFIEEVFAELPKQRWWKKLKKRLLTSRYNKQIFKIERF